MSKDKIARETLTAYADAWRDNTKEAWLELFAEDAEVIDPVGAPGHRGEAEIAAFWDRIRATGMTMNPTVHRIAVCGSEAMLHFTMTSTVAGGMGMAVEIVDIFTLNGEGKILQLKAYWDQGCTKMVTAGV